VFTGQPAPQSLESDFLSLILAEDSRTIGPAPADRKIRPMKKNNVDVVVLSQGTRNVLRGIFLLFLVLGAGTIGYMLIEQWGFLDALYMTVITITTVGYGEIRQVDGAGRIFTITLIFFGMGIMAYTVGMVAQVMVELQLRPLLGRRKLELQLKSIKEHYIICGYGRIGRIIAHELQVNKIPLLVIDSNPDSKQDLERDGIPYIIGDATNEDVFVEAGIERAKGLVSVVTSEADNLFITMTVRGMRPDLFILVRADADANRKKLVRAGASRVVMPYLIGGRKMAHTITRPAVTDFLEFTVHNKDIELKMEELLVGKACYIAVSLTCELKRLYSF
jgi:voltage-gated potassium channel